MAIIQYSSLVNKIIGKVGGSVFQVMGNTAGIRAHRNFRPSGSFTAVLSRGQLQELGRRWLDLGNSLQADWNLKALTYTLTNRYGATFNPSGYQLWILIQRVTYLATTAIDIFPQNYNGFTSGPIMPGNFVTGSSSFIINYIGSFLMNDYNIFYVTKPQPINTTFKHPKWYFIIAMPYNVNSTGNIYSLCMKLFGIVPNSSQKFFIKCRFRSASHNQWVESSIYQITIT
jgi:hypothetical protein